MSTRRPTSSSRPRDGASDGGRPRTGYGLIEGPVWEPGRGLYFSDVASVCFGGDDFRDLYVVTGSRGGPRENCATVFRTRVDVRGVPRPLARVRLA